MSKVELFEKIRREHAAGEASIRGLAREHGVHRRTVREALASAVPAERKTPERESPALGPHKEVVRAWLVADLQAPKKQRHTARRVWSRLLEERGAQVAESTVRAFVREVKLELAAADKPAAVPQTHPLGAEAEVDFGQFVFDLAGERLRGWLFVLRLSASGKAFRKAFLHQCFEAFADGHLAAFECLGALRVERWGGAGR